MKDKHRQMSCSICNKTFAGLQSLRKHNLTHHLENILETHSFTANVGFVVPQNELQSPVNAQCQSDNQPSDFKRPQQLQTIQDSEEQQQDTVEWMEGFKPKEEKSNFCSDCGKSFRNRRNLMRHLRIHTGEKPYNCPDCERVFDRQDKFKLHRRTHTGVKPYRCPECHRWFTRLDHLKLHKKIHVKDNYRQMFCSVCDKTFAGLQSLRKHNLTHHPEKILETHSFTANVGFVVPQNKEQSPVNAQCQSDNKYQPSDFKRSQQLQTIQDSEEQQQDTVEWMEGFKPKEEKSNFCSDCGKSFRQERDLIRHQRTHTGEKPYHCPDCDKSFARLDRLKLHKLTHTGEKPYHCFDCDKSFARLDKMKLHRKIHKKYQDRQTSFECSVCDKTSSGQQSLKKQNVTKLPEKKMTSHSFTANGGFVVPQNKEQSPVNAQCQSDNKYQPSDFKRSQQLQTIQDSEEQQQDTVEWMEGFKPNEEKSNFCSDCGKSFRQERDLIRHQRTHTGEKPYHCPDCDKSFARLDRLKLHKLTHTGEKPYHCFDCDKSFARLDKMKLHRKIHEKDQDRQTSCECSVCDKSFPGKQKLEKHQLVHKEKKRYRCSRCDKRFPDMAKLRSHLPIHTEELALYCSDCGKGFLNKAKLERHQILHHGNGKLPYLCPDCGEGLLYLHTLKEHQQIHSGEKPYSCSECGKNFSNENMLKRHQKTHMLKHSGERAACTCLECGKTFSRSCDVMTHVRRVHNKERPFQCSCCEKRFFQKNSLTVHMRSHTGEKPYHCSECGQSFSQLGDRNRHQKRQHSKEES